MPEGDTVLRTARRMHAALADRVLVRAELRWPDLGDVNLAGRRVLEVTAYGKQILTRLSGRDGPPGGAARPTGSGPLTHPESPSRLPQPDDDLLTLRSHLRMEGRWSIAPAARPWPAAGGVSVRAVLANTEWTAIGTWLGLLDLVPTAAEGTLIGHLGPDIMAADFPDAGRAESIGRLTADPRRPVGAALLDQTTVAGIGTMYMAETLFLRGISPWVAVADVDLGAVLDTARRLLLRGVLAAIPTTTGNPRAGQNTYVHGRSGKRCLRCGAIVRVASIGTPTKERTAFYCPVCQPGPTPTDDGRVRRPLGATPTVREDRRPTGYRRDR